MSPVIEKTNNLQTLTGRGYWSSFDMNWDRQVSAAISPIVYEAPTDIEISETFTAGIFNLVTSIISLRGIQIENQIEFDKFIKVHSSVITHLLDAPDKFIEYFGRSSPVTVEIFSDPDEESSNEELFFEVQTKLSPKKANETLSRMNREWLMKLPFEESSLLNVALKFV